MMKSFRPTDCATSLRVSEFWSWFMENEHTLRSSLAATDDLYDKMLGKLWAIDEGLRFEVCLNCTPCELVLSADGRAGLFDLVDATVAAAPAVDGWAFIALKPPMGFGFRTMYEGSEYDPATMWFLPLESKSDPSAVGIRVGLPGYALRRESELRDAVDVILRTGLGERSAASDIQYLEVAPLPANPPEHGFIELRELAEYIDWKKERRQ